MKYLFVMMICVLLNSCSIFSQHKHIVDDSITLCWFDNDTADCVYNIFESKLDPIQWELIGSTVNKNFELHRGKYKQTVYGISKAQDGDTSRIVSSVSESACLDFKQPCNNECNEVGVWYLDWSVSPPKWLRIYSD